jgi:hypothetical protein
MAVFCAMHVSRLFIGVGGQMYRRSKWWTLSIMRFLIGTDISKVQFKVLPQVMKQGTEHVIARAFFN